MGYSQPSWMLSIEFPSASDKMIPSKSKQAPSVKVNNMPEPVMVLRVMSNPTMVDVPAITVHPAGPQQTVGLVSQLRLNWKPAMSRSVA